MAQKGCPSLLCSIVALHMLHPFDRSPSMPNLEGLGAHSPSSRLIPGLGKNTLSRAQLFRTVGGPGRNSPEGSVDGWALQTLVGRSQEVLGKSIWPEVSQPVSLALLYCLLLADFKQMASLQRVTVFLFRKMGL